MAPQSHHHCSSGRKKVLLYQILLDFGWFCEAFFSWPCHAEVDQIQVYFLSVLESISHCGGKLGPESLVLPLFLFWVLGSFLQLYPCFVQAEGCGPLEFFLMLWLLKLGIELADIFLFPFSAGSL